MNRLAIIQSTKYSLEQRLKTLMEALTLDEKITLLSTSQSAVPRLGIKEYAVGGEAAHGVVDREGSKTSVFPQPIGLSQTWNKQLLYQVGSMIGDEARIFYQLKNEKTGLTLWAPTIDMERDPRWGRTEEAYGEDPYLTGELSKELIKGMQGEDPFYVKLVAAPKHFYGNNNEVGRESTSNSIDLRNRREYYLKAFEPAFKEGKALSMMTAYNGVNGIPCMQINEIEEIVRKEWGMDGFIVSDGGALTLNVEEYKYYPTYEEALADALKKGIDCFVDRKKVVEDAAKRALDKQLIQPEDIDRAVNRILKVRFRLGHFDENNRKNPYSSVDLDKMCSVEHQKLVREATDESIVLLTNNQSLLPLSKEIKDIAIIGPTANHIYRDWYTGYPPYTITPLAGIQNYLPDTKISFCDGFDRVIWRTKGGKTLTINEKKEWMALGKNEPKKAMIVDEDWGENWHLFKSPVTGKYLTLHESADSFIATKEEVFDWFNREKVKVNPKTNAYYQLESWNGENISIDKEGRVNTSEQDPSQFERIVIENGIDQAVEMAKNSEVAVVCVGNHPMINGKETEDRKNINLADYQQELIRAVYQANPNMILVVISSYPYALNWEKEHIPAIIYSSHGSQELGNSLAATLFGENNPSGKLSMTWYKNNDLLPSILNYDIRKGKSTYQYAEDNVLFPFGHGLHYAEVSYHNLQTEPAIISNDQPIKLSFTIRNESNIPVKEVVQIYVRFTETYYERPNKLLVGFEKVVLLPKEEKSMTISIHSDQLHVFDVRKEQYILEKGFVQFLVGSSSEELFIRSDLYPMKGEEITGRSLDGLTPTENYDAYDNVYLTKGEEEKPCVTTDNEGWIMFRNVEASDNNQITIRAKGSGVLKIYDNEKMLEPLCSKEIDTKTWNDVNCVLKPWQDKKDIYLWIEKLKLQSIQWKRG